MQWKKTAERKKTYFELTIESVDMSVLTEIFSELLKLIGQYQGDAWKLLKCEIWPETGSIIIYPANQEIGDRSEKAAFRVVVERLANDYLSLEQSEKSEDTFDKSVNTLMTELCNLLNSSYLAMMPKKRIYICNPDEEKLN